MNLFKSGLMRHALTFSDSKKAIWFYALCTLFIVINGVFFANEFYLFTLLPVVLLIVFLSLFSLDKLLLIIVFFTPLSINLRYIDPGLGVSLPTEPIMFGVMLIFIVRLFYERKFDKKVAAHPVTIAILINLLWIFITSITSEIPLVSFKFLLSRLWFVISFYFLGTQLFKSKINIKHFYWLFIFSLCIVIFYTLYNHYLLNFAEDPANWVMTPFYNDHTIYGAILAMFFPMVIFNFLYKGNSAPVRLVSLLLIIVFIVALIFSYTRAAWMSLSIAFGVYLLLLLRIKFRTILITSAVLLVIGIAFQSDIMMALESNKQDASDNFGEHIQSMSNISSDASNLERLNRWSAALRMFKERPFVGWGPGTYSFVYAPFQSSNEKTIISTNAGNRGNAHSEYIGPLSESGMFGMFSFLIIVACVIYTGIKLYRNSEDKQQKFLALAILLGLITYFVHGALNNFLDSDKASVPFWGFIAMLVSMDINESGN